MTASTDLIGLSACDVVGLLRRSEVAPADLLDALESRIAAVDSDVNALPTLCFDRARAHADALLKRPRDERGRLAGLPVPIKDLTDVAGVRTTYGSPIFESHVPETSDLAVTTLESNGAIVYAKSNTPEFGAGGNTFNEVFGRTLNPWNTSRSAAGSSGGAAAALATGMAWAAHGSDMGGSLRNPASFCGVVGLRPSPGRVAVSPGSRIDQTLSVDGPMARSVEDVALLLDAMTGEQPCDPRSVGRPAQDFLESARSGWKPRKVAWGGGLGITPVDPEVLEICARAAARFAEAGVETEEAHPDLADCHESFRVLRALSYACGLSQHLAQDRDRLKPEVAWNIEQGLALSGGEIVRAETQRWQMFQRALRFFEEYDLLLTPATIVPPFPAEQRYVTSCGGHDFGNYFEWLAIAYAVTLVCCPALSLLCGFTGEGLPVGLQLVARPRGEAQLLAGARLLEEILDLRARVPIDPIVRPEAAT
jgi:amidase